jgi:ribonuclease Z
LNESKTKAEVRTAWEFEDRSAIHAAVLDHGIPSIAYRYFAAPRSKVNIESLRREGLTEGSWIKDLQSAVHEGKSTKIEVDGKAYPSDELAKLVLEQQKQFSISYLTDIGFTETNLAKIRQLMMGTHKLVCEASFLNQDRHRGKEKMHLTTKQAALIAAYVQAEELVLFHISNIYKNPEESVQEGQRFFEEFRQMDAKKLATIIAAEFQRSVVEVI